MLYRVIPSHTWDGYIIRCNVEESGDLINDCCWYYSVVITHSITIVMKRFCWSTLIKLWHRTTTNASSQQIYVCTFSIAFDINILFLFNTSFIRNPSFPKYSQSLSLSLSLPLSHTHWFSSNLNKSNKDLYSKCSVNKRESKLGLGEIYCIISLRTLLSIIL